MDICPGFRTPGKDGATPPVAKNATFQQYIGALGLSLKLRRTKRCSPAGSRSPNYSLAAFFGVTVARFPLHCKPSLTAYQQGRPQNSGCLLSDTGGAHSSQSTDHNDTALGTFSQFYYYNDRYYKGPGSPVILFTPGEENLTSYTSYLDVNRTTGVIAEKIGAAVVVLEHRYWGMSSPYAELTTSNLRYLTLMNAITDLTHFANTANLPFDPTGSSTASKVPWILVGASYSGALAAWTESVAPGTFWTYIASSAPVEAIFDYWAYFAPVQLGMPSNCSKDVSLVIDHIDLVLTNGSADDQQRLKNMFGLGALSHNDDFGAAIEWAPWLWQSNQFYTTAGFYEWCDSVENVVPNSTAPLPGPEGVGLDKALAGYATWVNDTLIPNFCASEYGYTTDSSDISCFDTYNVSNPLFTDTSLSNTADRQWEWMLCNEPFGYWQDGAPTGQPSIVSRLVTAEYWQRQCAIYFPPDPVTAFTFGSNRGLTETEENAYTGGWNIENTTRLIYTNGEFDPWREAGVSSDQRPGGPLQSSTKTPVNVVPGGFHGSDMVTQNGIVNAGCKSVIDAGMWIFPVFSCGPTTD